MGEILYHHTDINGFMGMFCNCSNQNRKLTLRATSSNYMNDTSERVYAIKEIAKYINIIEKRIPKNIPCIYPRLEMIIKNEDEEILRWINNYINWDSFHLISCFSKTRDYLPLWGRYADNGSGIALGFDRDALFNQFRRTDNRLVDVLYEDYEKLKDFNSNKLCEIRIDYYENWNRFASVEDFLCFIIYKWCNDFKHPSFAYEQEIRLVTAREKRDSTIKYMTRNGLIVPYVEIDLDVNCISEIIIGPTKSYETTRQSLCDFLQSKSAICEGRDNIVKSSVPYRC